MHKEKEGFSGNRFKLFFHPPHCREPVISKIFFKSLFYLMIDIALNKLVLKGISRSALIKKYI